MGGCCCCSSRRAQLDGTPVYYYCPQALEERQPLSSSLATSSALSTGLLVDTNLDTSTPDTYRSPPAPMPYDADLGRPPTPPGTLGSSGNKIDTATRTGDSESPGETISSGAIEACSLKELDCTNQADSVPPSPKKSDEPAKLSELIASPTEEEDVCPTCLEEYDEENPRIITKCEHHFHLSCILEWMERSDTCPVCDQVPIM
ncbi:zinc finger protein [Macleaya cordata]|uniref:RING-type E3 ubiquitin transferase n=1 Tax=Macleaya cordata TaxID=56857 RepID=A0A200QU47_MACCD|nr:zinc finger protein [Macleaya cordata]